MKSGFTLVEMLVVMAIVSILSVVVLADYRWGGHQYSLRRSAGYLSQDLRGVQEMAMSVREVSGGKIPPGGYGINLKALDRNYKVFGEISDPLNYEYNDGTDEVVSVTNLEEDVEISNMCLTDNGGVETCGYSSLNITFTPPDPTIRFNGSENYTEAVIILKSLKTEEVAEVVVGRSGLVRIR